MYDVYHDLNRRVGDVSHNLSLTDLVPQSLRIAGLQGAVYPQSASD